MRELKFRMWDEKYNCWDKSSLLIYPDEEIKKKGRIIQWFTGLTDKNGKEVYEGDIVKINRCYIRPFVNRREDIEYKLIEGEIEIGQVIWGWNTQKYLVSYEHIRYDDVEDFDSNSHRVEVIGNIFETLELLK